jgi:nitroreductase
MNNYIDLIKKRRSVRTFDSERISEEDLNKIKEYARSVDNPYGIEFEWFFLDAGKDDLNVPVIVDCDIYMTGKTKKVEHLEEAFGYSFEKIVLYAQSLGVGTTWIAGTMDRKAFERAVDLKDDEVMPCISPLGYPAAKMAFREIVMRKGIKADTRKDNGELFFDEEYNKPLIIDENMKDVFEGIRLAPSAVNKQPWRIIRKGNSYHFYLKQELKGEGTLDIQKIDIGIALCHFDLLAKEKGLSAKLSIEDPDISVPDSVRYIATCTI